MNRPYHHGALREALLAAAEVILEHDGVEALTLRATARKAGVSHGSPAHHFGDLSGLLSELAAIGFIRFHERLQAEAAVAGRHSPARVVGLCRGYVGFARDSPALFQLMFRSGRLDWSRPALATAGADAFTLLTEQGAELRSAASDTSALITAMGRWSLVHGLSMLIIDGRLGPIMEKASGPDIETLVEALLTSALLPGHES